MPRTTHVPVLGLLILTAGLAMAASSPSPGASASLDPGTRVVGPGVPVANDALSLLRAIGVDDLFVEEAGDTMTGDLNFSSDGNGNVARIAARTGDAHFHDLSAASGSIAGDLDVGSLGAGSAAVAGALSAGSAGVTGLATIGSLRAGPSSVASLDVAGNVVIANGAALESRNAAGNGGIPMLHADAGNNVILDSPVSGLLSLQGRGREALRITGETVQAFGNVVYVNDNIGRVGIRTSNPIAMLDVQGNLNFDGQKVCMTSFNGANRVPLFVPAGWTAATCLAFQSNFGGIGVSLGCIFQNGYSVGAQVSPGGPVPPVPSPNCGW